jgi:hypothetical protein
MALDYFLSFLKKYGKNAHNMFFWCWIQDLKALFGYPILLVVNKE